MRFVRRDKKGMLLASETLKIILAVISIGFLIFLLTSLYFSNIHSKKLTEATSTIKRVSEIVQRINNGEVNEEEITTLSPAGWHFFSFTEEDKPNSCAGQDCLCICDKVYEVKFLGVTQSKECSDKGVCLIIQNLKDFSSFEIGDATNPIDIEIKKIGIWMEVNKI